MITAPKQIDSPKIIQQKEDTYNRIESIKKIEAAFAWFEERVYVCGSCGMTMNRDSNASLNLSRLGHSRIYACGHDTSTVGDKPKASIVVETRNLPCIILHNE